MKFNKAWLQDLVHGESATGEIIEKTIVDVSRWSIIYDMIFSANGKLYRTTYSKGATEQQEEAPFEYDPEDIECEEVVPQEKTVVAFVPASSVELDTIPPYGTLMTSEEMQSSIKCGAFIDSDGFGSYSNGKYVFDVDFNPSDFNPKLSTHVVWYNT